MVQVNWATVFLHIQIMSQHFLSLNFTPATSWLAILEKGISDQPVDELSFQKAHLERRPNIYAVNLTAHSSVALSFALLHYRKLEVLLFIKIHKLK